jgi:hypothetical protein
LVVAQIILLSQWFSKKTNQKYPIKMVMSKMTCPKWHFGQVEYKGKNVIWGVFLPKFPIKKVVISHSDLE